jgi:hypothetical protein
VRIVGWPEFSTMPQGTVFQMTDDNSPDWGELRVLDEVWTWPDQDGRGDFRDASLLPTIGLGSSITGANKAALSRGDCDGDTFTIHPGFLSRDGLFEFERQWLIWEREDLERLASWLLDPMKALHAIGYRIGETALPMPENTRTTA